MNQRESQMPEVVGIPSSREEIAVAVRRFLEEAAVSLRCERLIVLTFIPQGRLLRASAGVGFEDPLLPQWQWSVSDFAAADRALQTLEVSVLTRPTLPPELARHFRGEIAIVPLTRGARVLALLVGQVRPEAAPRSPAWQSEAAGVAARGALLTEWQRVAHAYLDEVSLRASSRRLAADILEAQPLADIGQEILRAVTERLREPRAALFVRDAGDHFSAIAFQSVSQSYAEATATLRGPNPLLGRALASGLPIHARTVQGEPTLPAEMRALFRDEAIEAVLITALQRKGEPTGALALYTAPDRQFSPSELTLFQSFADLAAIAVAMTRQMEEHREVAIIGERNRLAREMHDTVAQTLAAVVLQAETAQSLLEQGDLPTARELMGMVRVQAKQALEDTRRAVQGIGPAALEEQSPVQAISDAVHLFESETGLPTQFILTGEEQPLLPEQCAALLRIAQEALTNARKYASAHRVRVGIQFQAESVTLLVEDDGVGFDVDSVAASDMDGGYGLFGMRERARLLDGDLAIESTPGWGTRLRALLPYRLSSILPPRPQAAAQPRAESRSAAAAQAGGRPIRVLVVDDHAVARQGIRGLLETSGDIQVAGEASDGASALDQARRLAPDVVLMDLQMPGVGGIEGLRAIRSELPELPVVILTSMETGESLREAMTSGARGYLLKDTEPHQLMEAVRAAYRGETLFSAEMANRLVALTDGSPTKAPASDAVPLNEREVEILRMLARGTRNKEIAAALFVSAKTVEYHTANLFSKLGVSNRTEAARVAMERGLN